MTSLYRLLYFDEILIYKIDMGELGDFSLVFAITSFRLYKRCSNLKSHLLIDNDLRN